MTDYYARRLSGERLRDCYALASRRLRRYLQAEIDHLIARIPAGTTVLELGCGYGRVLRPLVEAGLDAQGVDNAPDNLRFGRAWWPVEAARRLHLMDALHLGFEDQCFESVVCVQNGICAFGQDQLALLREALRVLRPGGQLMLTSYADLFWPQRLAWFEAQADARLLGPLDRAACRDGWIVCQDGFRSGRLRPSDFAALAKRLDLPAQIEEIDGSFVCCELRKPG